MPKPVLDTVDAAPLAAETSSDPLDQRLADRLSALRAAAGWSLDELSLRSGISRATLSRLERAESSPSATLLNRLCAAFGLTMSRLLADVEAAPVRLLRSAEQAQWKDESTGFRRRMVAPPAAGYVGELIEGRLPAGASIAYEHPPVPGLEQHLWLHEGALRLTLQEQAFELRPGDSLSFKLWGQLAIRIAGRRNRPLHPRGLHARALTPPTHALPCSPTSFRAISTFRPPSAISTAWPSCCVPPSVAVPASAGRPCPARRRLAPSGSAAWLQPGAASEACGSPLRATPFWAPLSWSPTFRRTVPIVLRLPRSWSARRCAGRAWPAD